MSKKPEINSAFPTAADESVGLMSNHQLVEQRATRARFSPDGAIQVGGITVTSVGFDVATIQMSEADYEELGTTIFRMEGAVQWLIGDWIAYGENQKWGETAGRVAALFKREITTIYDYTRVCRAVYFKVRTSNLSFAHHKLVASIKGASLQADWLHRAERGGWTVAEMREEMRRDGTRQELDRATRLTNSLKALWKRSIQDAEPQERRQMLDAIRQWLETQERET